MTLGAAATANANVRVVVVGSEITVEVNGYQVWIFNTAGYVHTDGTSYDYRAAYTIALSYSATVTGNSATGSIPELWAATDAVTLQTGASVSSAINKLCTLHRIRYRATATGGLEFGQFVTRDDAGTLTRGATQHAHKSDDSQAAGLVLASGAQSGAFLNAAWIAANGFSFKASTVSELQTTQQASAEAQLQSRESVEMTLNEEVSGLAMLADQPEDAKTLVYTPGGLAPSQASIDCVITSLDWTRTSDAILTASWKMRRAQAWVV